MCRLTCCWPLVTWCWSAPGRRNPAFYPETSYSGARVPGPRHLADGERRLLALYERAEAAARAVATRPPAKAPAPGEQAVVRDIHRVLAREYPQEWLLRWNLLEILGNLGKVAKVDETGGRGGGGTSATRERLREELELLEETFGRREPIASGLRYLSP